MTPVRTPELRRFSLPKSEPTLFQRFAKLEAGSSYVADKFGVVTSFDDIGVDADGIFVEGTVTSYLLVSQAVPHPCRPPIGAVIKVPLRHIRTCW